MKLRSTSSVLHGEILVPASKSHTIRAVALAAVAEGTSVLKNPLMSDDAKSAVNGAVNMGAEVELGKDWIIKGVGGVPRSSCKEINVGNSGTSLRILTGLCSLASHPIIFDGDDSIRKRPMMPLLSALEKLGVVIRDSDNGKCPFTIQGPIKGGSTIVNGVSSQFLTSLLLACPLAKNDSVISVEELNEKPYVEITLDWLRRMDIRFEQKGLEWFRVFGNQQYHAFERSIPADFSTAAFPLLAAAITQSEVLIKGLDFNDHQGDKEVFTFLEKMGAKLSHRNNGVLVKGGPLKGADIDMNNTPDALPAMAVAACYAQGTTRLLNVPQARLKECDRIAASAKELRKMGAQIEELEDGMMITGSRLKGAEVHGYNDHRMVMALSIAGFSADGETVVDTAESAGVTYPDFITDMKNIGGQLETFKS